MSRTTKRNLIVIVVAVLLAVFVSTLVGTLSNGYDDITEPGVWGKERNPDNLIPVVNADSLMLNQGPSTTNKKANGIYEISVNKNGVISIETDEENDTTASEHFIECVSFELEPGTYTFSCEKKGDFKGDIFVATKGSSYVAMEDTFTVDSEGTYYLVIEIAPNSEIDTTIMPVLVKGKYAGDFYLD